MAIIASAISAVPTAVGSVAIRLHVVGDILAFGNHVGDRFFQFGGGFLFAQILQHQLPGQNQCRGVDFVLPFVLGRGTVGRLEQRGVVADIGSRRNPQSPNKPRAQVGQNIAVQVFHHQNVVVFRLPAPAAYTSHRPAIRRIRHGLSYSLATSRPTS